MIPSTHERRLATLENGGSVVCFATMGLEYFEDFDTNNAVAAVPKSAANVNVQLVEFNATDIIEAFSVDLSLSGTSNNYTGSSTTSPWFPYIFVGNLEVPFQSGNLKMISADGHIVWLWSVLRGQNPQQIAGNSMPLLGDQAAVLSTGYSAQTNQSSAANYAMTLNNAKTYKFNLRVNPALYFRNFYDDDGKGNIGVIPDVYVNPLMMSSSGRHITPKLQLNPFFSSTADNAILANDSGGTVPTWTDGGSIATWRRSGWRDPGQQRPIPPQFTWAHIYDTFQFTFGATAKFRIPFPDNGQLLAVIFRGFDPTLNSGRGGAIPVANVVTASLTYGPGLVKYNDSPAAMQRRILKQHGVLLTDGVWVWDLYANSQSNQLGEIINTYITAGVVANFDYTGNTPGAGSYFTVSAEWLTQVQ